MTTTPGTQSLPQVNRGAIARMLPRLLDPWTETLVRVARRLEVGHLTVILPDGRSETCEGESERDRRALLRLKRPRAARRLLLGGDLGFAEAYVDGDWDTPDLAGLLDLAQRNEAACGAELAGLAGTRWLHRLRHLLRPNSRTGSRRNIAAHYDISNAFYALWLDPSMTYSSALFAPGCGDLQAAQEAKYRRLADSLDLKPDHALLEIGCGWGSFAIFAAATYGCRVTAVTLSQQQYLWARARVAEAGLSDRVDVRLEDYRDITGEFDRVASIEMFEAVGEAYWPAFFQTVRRRLRPHGVAALQVISVADDRFDSYRRRADFIQRYIFPGGMLPSPSIFERRAAEAGFSVTDRFSFGLSYATTLSLWQRRFQAAWPQIAALGFGTPFKRLWEYYLAYCEAGFRAGSIDVGQYRLSADGG